MSRHTSYERQLCTDNTGLEPSTEEVMREGVYLYVAIQHSIPRLVVQFLTPCAYIYGKCDFIETRIYSPLQKKMK